MEHRAGVGYIPHLPCGEIRIELLAVGKHPFGASCLAHIPCGEIPDYLPIGILLAELPTTREHTTEVSADL